MGRRYHRSGAVEKRSSAGAYRRRTVSSALYNGPFSICRSRHDALERNRRRASRRARLDLPVARLARHWPRSTGQLHKLPDVYIAAVPSGCCLHVCKQSQVFRVGERAICVRYPGARRRLVPIRTVYFESWRVLLKTCSCIISLAGTECKKRRGKHRS